MIAHDRGGRFDVPLLLRMAREWPGLEGMDLAVSVTCETHFGWEGGVWRLGFGYADGRKFNEVEANAAHRPHVVAIDYGSKRNIFRSLVKAGAKVTVLPRRRYVRAGDGVQPGGHLPLERPRRSRRDRRLCGAGDPSVARYGPAVVRHLPRPPDAGARRGGEDQQDAPGPPRRQPPRSSASATARSRSPA